MYSLFMQIIFDIPLNTDEYLFCYETTEKLYAYYRFKIENVRYKANVRINN